MSSKNISVQKRGTVINVKVFECFNSKDKVFEAEARVGNKKEIDSLLEALRAKGVNLNHSKKGWFD